MSDKEKEIQPEVKRTVLDVDDIVAMAPALANHRRLVEWLMHILSIDRVNETHSKFFDTPGAEFSRRLLADWDTKLDVDGIEVLKSFAPGTPFITVSNHPFGAIDGIALIALVATIHPDYKVMVNMILNHLTAMRPNFIAVDALASDDPAKQAVSRRGIKEVISRIREGHPVGFFPAGAVSKLNWKLQLRDRQWQPSVVRLIQQLKVPVVPIYFHGSNTAMFNILGVLSWQLRTLRLPSEVFRKAHSSIHISVGQPISVEEQQAHQGSTEEFGEYLKAQTYALRDNK